VADEDALVLLHALGMSPRVWDGVRPWLEPHRAVVALTTLGHRGGTPAARGPVRVSDLVDHAERALDERGLERPHVAGNSLGAWMAIELARRGRARTVCALSPAGAWTAGTAEQAVGVRKIRAARRGARLGRRVPVLMRSAVARRLALGAIAVHGERTTAEQALQAAHDLVDCPVVDDILATDEEIAPLDPLPCPITLAWAGADAITPVEVNGAVARARLPRARFLVLSGVGHVPMIDDPHGVAATILLASERG
jgi:pimeloyl-ACP methyl ester carboxylesterase